jgi:hypothetical protein
MMQRGMHMQTLGRQGTAGLMENSGGYTRPGPGGRARPAALDTTYDGRFVGPASLSEAPAFGSEFNILGGAGTLGGPNTPGESAFAQYERQMAEFAAQAGELAQQSSVWAPFVAGLSQGMATALSTGIGAGFDTLFATGNIGAAFRDLAGAMVSGFGNAIAQFGEAALAAAILQQGILKSLAALIPGGAIVSAIAMIALGKALAAAGQKAFGGGVPRGAGSVGSVGTYSAGTSADVNRSTVVIELPRKGYVDPRDPYFQQFLVETMALAQGRRLEFRET